MPFEAFVRLPDRIGSVPDLVKPYIAPAPPVHDTVATVEKGLKQIEKVIDYMSPFERQKRMIAGIQLKMQRQMMEDYQKNPDKYQVGANGAIRPIGVHGSLHAYKSMGEVLKVKDKMLSIKIKENKLRGMSSGPGEPDYYRQLADAARKGRPAAPKKEGLGDANVNLSDPFGPLALPQQDVDITDEEEDEEEE